MELMPQASIRQAVREVIEPWLARNGFDGKYPEYWRLTGDQYHGLAVRKDKYGGYFWIEVGAKPFSLTRYRRLLKTGSSEAKLPRLIDLEFSQRKQINPALQPDDLLDKSQDGVAAKGKKYAADKLREASQSCIPRVEAWFRQNGGDD